MSFTEVTTGGVSRGVIGMSSVSTLGKRGLGGAAETVGIRNKRGRFEVVE